MAQLEATPSVASSRAEVWYLKKILFGAPGDEKKSFRIITQNLNGPCSFIAICNILILRGDIIILPEDRTTASYEFLSQLVAEYLLTRNLDIDISAALSIMPQTQKGMDLNPSFDSLTSFRPPGDGEGGLDLFDKAGIKLVHGWLVDLTSDEAEAVKRVNDYDRAVELIAEVDHLTDGKFVFNEDTFNGLGGDSDNDGTATSHTEEQKSKIKDAMIVSHFLESTSSQLTYTGLFNLVKVLEPHKLYALFRNSHLSVIYKTTGTTEGGDDNSALYSLVTDQVFLREPSVVWEKLEDVDGSSSIWVDANFRRSDPAGGDFAGQTAEDVLSAADYELARQLQAQELAEQEDDGQQGTPVGSGRKIPERKRIDMMSRGKLALKKKRDCVIM